ncbi:alpha/beta hydrolase, partial [Microvirga sp. 3-52]|nr:alpha/beta hydrolase [Microvirga sp. 3-52]
QTGMLDFVYQRNYFKEHNYQVILPDLRGHGMSKVDEINILTYIEDSAEDLYETLDHLAIEHVHIVGASLGALVGLVFSKQYPERVASLTLSGIIPEKPYNWIELQAQDLKMQASVLKNEGGGNPSVLSSYIT